MKVGVFANTPAQVHFFKNICRCLGRDGHEVFILYRDYGETKSLINEMKLPGHLYSSAPISKIGKLLALPSSIGKASKYLRANAIDIVAGFGIYETFSSIFMKIPSIVFTDSEPISNKITYSIQFRTYSPFISAIITPSSFLQNLGKKHIRVNSYKELAYLHPNYFKPDDSIFDLLDIEKGEEYAVLRFNAFDAVHDAGIRGFSPEDKVKLVKELEKDLKVFISSEAGVPEEIKDRVLRIPKSRIHDVLFFSKLLVADTGTMVTEAAVLGTPAVMFHPKVHDFGNFVELEGKYGLIFGCNKNSQDAIAKAIELAKEQNVKREWAAKREKLLKEKIDMTGFMVWFIENYPESFEVAKEKPGFHLGRA
ncbi:MAG: DUF354 domain-containing protein [Methanomassiliicoccales archaeon]|nr:DUF354 domain-containing protein [Methanomassiliicoccales archaeon]